MHVPKRLECSAQAPCMGIMDPRSEGLQFDFKFVMLPGVLERAAAAWEDKLVFAIGGPSQF